MVDPMSPHLPAAGGRSEDPRPGTVLMPDRGGSDQGPRLTDAHEYFAAYAEYSKVLRTWFVAYGIGGPILFVTNASIAEAMSKAGGGKLVPALFLAGVALQVILSAFNKASMWALYFGEINDAFKTTRRYKFSEWFGEQFWIDLLIDVASFGCFAVATWLAYQILVR